MKKRLLHNGKMLVVCGAMAYLAIGATSIRASTPSTASENVVVITVQEETQEETQTKCYDFNKMDRDLLAEIAMAKAESEDIYGKALVMMVVINRSQSDKFPKGIRGVLYEEKQFDGWNSVVPNQECYDALDMIENGWDESHGALYFNRATTKKERENLEFLFQYGNQDFYTEKGCKR